MVKCGGCGKFISPLEGAKCGKCTGIFHKQCVNIPAKANVSEAWLCPNCKAALPRDNHPSTPVRGIATYVMEEQAHPKGIAQGHVEKTMKPAETQPTPVTAGIEMMQQILGVVQGLKTDINVLSQNNSLLMKEVSQLKSELLQNKQRLEKLDLIELELKTLREETRERYDKTISVHSLTNSTTTQADSSAIEKTMKPNTPYQKAVSKKRIVTLNMSEKSKTTINTAAAIPSEILSVTATPTSPSEPSDDNDVNDGEWHTVTKRRRSNKLQQPVVIAPVQCNLSDHCAVRATVPCAAGPGPPPARMLRCYSRANRCSFVAAIDSIDWADVISRKGGVPNDLAQAIINIIKNKIDICFPLKLTMIKNKDIYWATDEIFNLNSLLLDMRELTQKFPCNIDLQTKINSFQDIYNDLIQSERSEYYCKQITQAPNVIKSMWDVVKSETGKSRIPLDYTEVLTRADGSKYASKSQAVDAINAHFVNAATSCGAPAADVDASSRALANARPPADCSLRLKQFTPIEVLRIMTQGVARKSSKDVFDISISLLHSVAPSLAQVLSILYNQCLSAGTYPSHLKFVKVSPLYKGKGKPEDVNSYRPVSIIPAIAKIFEFGLSARLSEYLSECKSLSDRQYAYRSGRSTTALTRELIRRIIDAREKRQQVAVIFCDLSKAFDVADHSVLAVKLRHYGIHSNALRLLSDFMSERCQVVVGEGGTVRSEPLKTVIGVAQGSSLSNIMFSLLLNDLPENICDGHVLMYADDVAAIVTAQTVSQLEVKLNKVANDLNHWFHINGLILNINKTHFVHFDLSGHRRDPLHVRVGEQTLEQLKDTTFLGFHIDSALTWEGHVDKLCAKIGRASFALWRLSAVLPRWMVLNCYYASVHSLLQYGVEFWGRSADWERVFRMQKRAVRAIVRLPQDSSALPLFKSMKLLTVPSLAILQAALYAKDKLHEYSRVDSQHTYDTRHGHVLRAPPRRLVKAAKQIHLMARDVYNSLPDHIKDAPSKQSYKTRLKKWLAENTFYAVTDFLNTVEHMTVRKLN